MTTRKELEAVLEKMREELSYKYSANLSSHRNCYTCCDTDSKHEDAFQAGHDSLKPALITAIEDLEKLSQEQEIYVSNKDYFSEVVRLNLMAKETLEKIMEKLK